MLELRDIDKPEVGDDDVLVRIRAAGVHIGDRHVMTGLPYMLRVVGFGLLAPKLRVRGMDVAGTVEAIGQNVTQFQAGEEVFGTFNGSVAEYACAAQDKLAPKPVNLTFEQAAAVPTSGYAALQGLRDKGKIRAGQKILIIGGSGGVGMFAVQIANAFGAEGGGRWMGGTDRWFQALLLSPFVRPKMVPLASMERKEELVVLKGLIEAGKIVPVIDRTYLLSEVPEAMRYLESGRAQGKVVVIV